MRGGNGMADGKSKASSKKKLRLVSSSRRSTKTRRRFSSAKWQKDALRAILFLLFCIVMISPIQGCILDDGDYIGYSAAQKIAVDDAGIMADKVQDLHTDMIKINGEVYYKVEFTGSVTDYRYIIDAETGDILTQVFYRLDKTD